MIRGTVALCRAELGFKVMCSSNVMILDLGRNCLLSCLSYGQQPISDHHCTFPGQAVKAPHWSNGPCISFEDIGGHWMPGIYQCQRARRYALLLAAVVNLHHILKESEQK